jgi:hypothetical protein
VREDHSPHGEAWDHFTFDQAQARAFRWGEDGIAGICDREQRLCLALTLWNGHDPLLKERLFGLGGKQGNRGEDVKECYFHLDATPSHSWLRYRYMYPQGPFPYAWLVAENARRGRADPPATLHDSGAFREGRYWDIEVRYAKASPERIHLRLIATNRGPEPASLWLLPSLWFRNTWSWCPETPDSERPRITPIQAPTGAAWAVRADHPTLGTYHLYGRRQAELLFTENDPNRARLWGQPYPNPYVKDAFHRYLIEGDKTAVNPAQLGTKLAACHRLEVAPGETVMTGLVLSRGTDTTDTDTDRKFNRLCEPKVASAREASEGQRAGQGATESGADISQVSECASAGFERRLQAQRAGVRSGAAAPFVAEDGGYQETRWSNPKPGSGWAMRSQSGVGSGASSQAGGPRAGVIGGGRGGSPMWVRICSTDAASVINEMIRMSAPQLGQISGRDSNSRARSMAQR